MIAHVPPCVSASPPLPRSPSSGLDQLREAAGRSEAMTFGNFLVVPSARTLLRAGSPVSLGSRAFDLLVLLLRSRGRIVSKEEIVRHVWPALFVEESNLRFQMASLRRALGEGRDLIKTIPGRGYMLVAEIGSDPMAPRAFTRAPSPDRPWPSCRSDRPSGTPAVVVIERDWDLRDALRALLDALESDSGAPAGCAVPPN